jgi:hypothetical protein
VNVTATNNANDDIPFGGCYIGDGDDVLSSSWSSDGSTGVETCGNPRSISAPAWVRASPPEMADFQLSGNPLTRAKVSVSPRSNGCGGDVPEASETAGEGGGGEEHARNLHISRVLGSGSDCCSTTGSQADSAKVEDTLSAIPASQVPVISVSNCLLSPDKHCWPPSPDATSAPAGIGCTRLDSVSAVAGLLGTEGGVGGKALAPLARRRGIARSRSEGAIFAPARGSSVVALPTATAVGQRKHRRNKSYGSLDELKAVIAELKSTEERTLAPDEPRPP